jgi:hypothetical protein
MSDDSVDNVTQVSTEEKIEDAGKEGRPKRKTKFRPGQSGNPRGRPTGARNRKKIIEEIAFELHAVLENGVRVQRSTFELVVLTIRNLALEGNRRAYGPLHRLYEKYGSQESGQSPGCIIVPELGPNWKEMLKEQQDSLIARTAAWDGKSIETLGTFVSKYAVPRSRLKKG